MPTKTLPKTIPRKPTPVTIIVRATLRPAKQKAKKQALISQLSPCPLPGPVPASKPIGLLKDRLSANVRRAAAFLRAPELNQ